LVEEGEGEGCDGDVGHDVYAGVGEPALNELLGFVVWLLWDMRDGGLPDGPLAQTFAVFDRFVPEVLDRSAEEDCAEDRPAGPCEDESHQTVVENAKEAVRKDAQVLQQDRKLAQKQREIVDDDRGPEGFQGCDSLVWCQCFEVATHAIFNCYLSISMF
jgi:hypothetical protein